MKTQIKPQSGVALLTVMMIVALISIVGISIVSEQALIIKRVQNILQVNQIYAVHLGIENVAALGLKQDLDNDEFDDLTQRIFEPIPPVPFGDTGALIAGEIKDLQGKFNINTVIDDQGQIDPAVLGILSRFLAALNLQNLEPIITDWIDDDVFESPGGAEDTYYQTLESPYLPANQAFVSINEFKMLKDVDNDPTQQNPNQNTNLNPNANQSTQNTFEKLEEYFVTLPRINNKINLNTASSELIQALFDIEQSKADQLITARNDKPFETVGEVKSNSALQGVDFSEIEELMSVQTEYFGLEATVTLGQVVTPLYSVLRRNQDGSVNVIQRVRGEI